MNHEPNSAWTTDTASFEIAELAIVARSMIVARKALRETLPVELIHDPALDILLHLFIAEVDHVTVQDDDASSLTTISSGSASRWVSVLSSYGFVERDANLLALSPTGRDTIRQTLCAVARSQWQFAADA